MTTIRQIPQLYLHGVGHFHPDNIIDNSFLSSLDIGVDPEWILKRVGIETRHTVPVRWLGRCASISMEFPLAFTGECVKCSP